MTTDTSHAVSLQAWAAEAEAAAGIARALAPTPFVPEQLRRWVNPDARPADRRLDFEGTVATVTAVLLAGQELGFGPMASLRSITVIRGTVALYALAARALLQQHGHEIVVKESTSTRAVVDGRRVGGQWQRSIWDLDRAKAARLYPGDERSNWRTQTKSMLVARATAEVSRWVASDAMLGLPLMAEEVEDDPLNGTVPAIGSVATTPEGLSRADADHAAEARAAENAEPAAKRTTKRAAKPARAALPKGEDRPPPAPPEPPMPEPPPAEPPQPPDPIPADVRTTEQLSKDQRTKILIGLREMHITARDEALGLLSAWVGHQLTSTNDLSADEASVVLDRIESLLHLGAAQVTTEPNDDDPGPPPPDDELEQNPP